MNSIKYLALIVLVCVGSSMAIPFGRYYGLGGGSNAYSQASASALGGSLNFGPFGLSGSVSEANAFANANSFGNGGYYNPYYGYGGFGRPFGGYYGNWFY